MGKGRTKTNQSIAIYQKWLCPVRQHIPCVRAKAHEGSKDICPSVRSLRENLHFKWCYFGGDYAGVSSAFAFLGMPLMCGILCIANAGRKTGWFFFSFLQSVWCLLRE
ncbi:hypothetical protein CEXT_394781 [Caerostris extrusa]|uniref:Uncharacterized protein n=1 Tax=Caerostris extrusa TaxID=172846 RepID=A0AAV4XA21_CAEEX|nr:hypothetical protein CEXT_394781 [Caerostris extrusa]